MKKLKAFNLAAGEDECCPCPIVGYSLQKKGENERGGDDTVQ